jgi:tetratricopeptide (TPR) repeat protein
MMAIRITLILFLLLLVAVVVALLPPGAAGPGSLLAEHHRGVALIEQHDFVAAEAVLLAVVERAPDAFVPRFNLAIAQLNQAELGISRALPTLGIARELDARSPRVPYCLGVIHRFLGDDATGLGEFRRAVELAPEDADANYQVAISLLHLGSTEEALPYFELAARLDPTILGVWNNLQLMYRREGREADADRALAAFQSLKDSGRGRAHSAKYTEQGDLALAIRDWEVPRTAAEALPLRFGAPRWLLPEVQRDLAAPAQLPAAALVDLDLDCIPELWVAGERGAIWSFRGAEPLIHVAPAPLLAADAFAVGDIDEDGIPEVVVATGRRLTVHGATGAPVPALEEKQRLDISSIEPVIELRLVDLDLEGDLDLLIIPRIGKPWIALNEGRQLREIGPPAVPWPDGPLPRDLRIAFARDLDGDADADLGLHGALAPPHLRVIANAPEWAFALDPEGAIPAECATSALIDPTAADLDGDMLDDLLVLLPGAEGNARFRRAPGTGSFFGSLAPLPVDFGAKLPVTEPASEPGALRAAALADLDLDGHLDLLVSAATADAAASPALSTWVLRNDGAGRFERITTLALPAAALFAGDVDGDFDPDVIALSPGGAPLFLRNETDPLGATPAGHALRTYLGGARDGADRRTNLLGYGTRVELRAGDLRIARTFEGAIGHRAQGLAPLIVGIGARAVADSLYLAWPDSVTQAETDLALDSCRRIEEVQRKMSSCPVLFAWDGGEYRFITDFMGGGGLGFWVAPGEFAPPEPTEVVRIAPGALAEIGGELRLSVMEPMQEIAYVDRLALLAVDHPPGTEVYPHEYFPVAGAPPSGAPLLVRTAERRFPVAVSDERGARDPALVAEVDRRYAGPAALDPDLVGYAVAHAWTFAFTAGESADPAERTYLFLDGWVEYPYSRINFAASQRARRLEAPTVRFDRGDGDWQLLGAEIGYPAGMPKTMALDVTHAVGSGATRFRIDTNLELYWDRVFIAPATDLGTGDLAMGTGSPRNGVPVPSSRSPEPLGSRVRKSLGAREDGTGTGLRPEPVPLSSATLRFGGYPREYSDDGALPATYHYAERDATLAYRPMGGLLTRYGRVDELLGAADDRFVIIGGGDELHLRYDAASLPPLPPGWQRTHLLDTHGWCKDRDPLTATPESVEPLPFGAMSAYPPPAGEREPDQSEYRRSWNSRTD